MATERRLKTLKARQKSLIMSFGLVVRFVNAYDAYDADTDVHEVPVRLEHLITIWNDFNAVQGELETLDDNIIEGYLQDRAAFETSYFKIKGFLLSQNKTPTPPSPTHHSHAHSLSSSHVRLPDIKLPVFDGDRWLNFHDLFLSLVHLSADLSNIQKFYYLRSSLTGDALKLVQTIAISANNYMVAWNILLDHYSNTTRLKQSYVDALFEFSPIKRESAADLHTLVENFEANVKILTHLGEQTQYWDLILIRMLSIRLDTARRDWEEYCSTKDVVSFHDLTAFIQRRVTVLQTITKSSEAPASNPLHKKPTSRSVVSHSAAQLHSRKCLM